MINNKFSKNNLKRLARYVYDTSDKCYHLISNDVISMSPRVLEEINDQHVYQNEANNDVAYSILEFKDKPLRTIYTGMRIRDRMRQVQQRLNYNPSLRC